MNAGKYGRASSALKDLLALDPLNAEARRLFATLHLRLGSLISARTAFESLAREAVERQDYWLAESLLREYLTAGPRCVPFLEMLGHVYEEKGDVMAAVAEYGKAVEVLLEDPDTDHPNRASDLFVRIRSLAPGSPVAFRFAAMFDTVTGQMLQAQPQPGVVDQASEPPQPITLGELPAGEAAAVAMPWEQVEPAPADVSSNEAVQVPAAGNPAGATVSIVAASTESVTEGLRQDAVPDEAPVTQTTDPSASSDLQLHSELSTLAATATEPDQIDIHSEAPVGDPAAAQTPESEFPSPPAAEVPALTIELLAQASIHPIAEAPASPAPMPWDQVEEAADVTLSDVDNSVPIEAEVPSAQGAAADLSSPPVVEAASPTIEICAQASIHPIVEAPASPAPMPWDQVEEVTSAKPPTAELKIDSEAIEADKTIEITTTDRILDSKPAAEPSLPLTYGITSSGLSWEDILAAVTAMQASSALTPTMPSEGSEACLDSASTEETTATVAPASDSSDTGSLSSTTPVPDPFGDATDDVSPLSAPMPWEQIEVDDVAIPRQEPEPEFGPIPADSVGGDHDSTLVMPRLPETHESLSAAAAPVDVTVADSPVHVDAISTPEFRILSPDAPFEPHEQPIHIPVEAIEPLEEPALATMPEAEQPVLSTIDLSAEPPLRLAVNEPIATGASNEPREVPVEALMESAVTASIDVPPDTALLVDEPMAQVPVEELTISIAQEAGAESSIRFDAHAIAADQPAVEDDSQVSFQSETPLEDVPIAPEQPVSPATSLPASSKTEAVVCDSGASQLIESAAPEVVPSILPEPPASEAISPQPTTAPADAGPGEPVQVPIETEQIPDPVPVDLQPSVDGSLRILWDDSSSAPIPNASTGNMLTRWLKKPKDVAPAETGYPTTIPDEPAAPVAPPSGDRQEAITLVAVGSVEQSDQAKPVPVGKPAARPNSSKPVVGRALRHVGQAMASVVSAGFSTTRSLIISLLTLIGFALVLGAGVVGGIALMWLFLEEQPNAAYHNMTSVPQRTLQDSGKNGYFLLLGFGAAANHDPVQTGLERRVEDADRAITRACLTGEGNVSGSHRGASEEVAGTWLKGADPAARMQMEASGVKRLVSQAEVPMGRYRQWLTMPFEDWGYGQPVSPNCGLILYAHRLYVAEGFAQDVDAGLTRLETDLGAWRTVLGHAKTLSFKMLASDAMNDDIALLGGLLLRPDLDERMVSRLSKLAQPLDPAEQSVRWPMQSRFVHAIRMLEAEVDHDQVDARPFYASVAASLHLPKQRRFNAYAEYYEAAGKAAAEGRFADLPKQSQFVRTPPYGLADLFVNPIESLVGIDPLPAWELYAGRVLETEARLRLASLQAWLRRTPSEPDLLTRIAKAGQGLYDPFTGFPMLVNMKKGVFYSVGQDLKDNDARDRFDVVAKIPPTAWADSRRNVDSNQIK